MHSSELKAQLKDLQTQANQCRTDIEKLEKKLAETKKQLVELEGSGWGHRYGEIQRLKDKIAQAEREEKDAYATVVVWKDEDRVYQNDRKYVVRRITKKRIYVAQVGSSSETYYNKDGTRDNGWRSESIDLEATFGKNYDEILS